MPQINIEVDEATGAALERAAARRGERRPEFMRYVVRCLVAAEAENRAPFEPQPVAPAAPISAEMVTALITKSTDQTVELERILTQNARREAALHKRSTAADAEHIAHMTSAEAKVSARLEDAVEPFRSGLAILQKALDEHSGFERIATKVASLETRLREHPPTVTKTYIEGIPMPSLLGLASIMGIVVVVGMILFLVLASWSTSFAVHTADKLLPGHDRFCALAEFRGEPSCTTPRPSSGSAARSTTPAPHAGSGPHRIRK